MGIIEVLASIFVVIVAAKLIIMWRAPKKCIRIAKKLSREPKVMSYLSAILALVVLYYLKSAGLSAVNILAVALFAALLIGSTLAFRMRDILANVDPKTFLSENWIAALIWALLALWGVKELLF